MDDGKDAAAKWAAEAKMPWPTILKGDLKEKTLIKPYFPGSMGVPSYVMVDATGKELARGKGEIMKKLEE